ncbi:MULTISPECIES: sensor histidine kinase [unclassified Crossiella]|uniref:sensor histidine kinase n=1 Tax=unclassified Crossiella TaxID=2620835 RepID=UPI001FFE7276|nr:MULTISPECIES: histidine kinase [unclassified Crossiella]MCK2244260.1 histidine kinase [Crossiella sp. S99.2]MCK2258064.1 histidine kinase [Crossiella sp. S99.1]
MKSRLRGWLIDIAVLAFATVEAVLTTLSEPTATAWFGVAAVLALLLRHRWPLPVYLLTLPAVAFLDVYVPAVVALYSISARYRNWWLLISCGLALTAGLFFPLPGPDEDFKASDLVLELIDSLMTAGGPILLGRFLQTRHELALRLEEVKQAREYERQLDAQVILTKERNQLAREMHDVVSHQVSLIAVQAGVVTVSTADPAVREAVEHIRTLSVNTLDELRHMVNLLRASGTPESELSPQPTLAELRRLIDNSGIDTQLVGTAPTGIEAPMQRAIYRTIQEALTNVRKHAPGAKATVEFRRDDSDLTVTVTNTAPTRPALALPSAQHGLVGLRERAALLDGRFHAGSTPDGGYQLRLRLPLT